MQTIKTKNGYKIIEPVGTEEPWPSSLSTVLASMANTDTWSGTGGFVWELSGILGITAERLSVILCNKYKDLTPEERQSFKDNFGWTDKNLPIPPEQQDAGLERERVKKARVKQIRKEMK